MFTPGQQKRYRPLVDAAWISQAEANGLEKKDKPTRLAWYQSELKKSIGLDSTVNADPGFDFDIAIAHFEGLADAGFYWRGRLRKSLFDRIVKVSRHKTATPEYCEAIIKQARHLDYTPRLESLNKDELILIIRALKQSDRRR